MISSVPLPLFHTSQQIVYSSWSLWWRQLCLCLLAQRPLGKASCRPCTSLGTMIAFATRASRAWPHQLLGHRRPSGWSAQSRLQWAGQHCGTRGQPGDEAVVDKCLNPGYLASCNNRGKGDKRVVDPWVGHLPSKKLSELKKISTRFVWISLRSTLRAPWKRREAVTDETTWRQRKSSSQRLFLKDRNFFSREENKKKHKSVSSHLCDQLVQFSVRSHRNLQVKHCQLNKKSFTSSLSLHMPKTASLSTRKVTSENSMAAWVVSTEL